jgi:hypothetical protein
MFKTVSEAVKLNRLEICTTCENFIKTVQVCKQCGCFMPAKALFAQAMCPANLWNQEKPGTDLINKLDEAILESWNKQ